MIGAITGDNAGSRRAQVAEGRALFDLAGGCAFTEDTVLSVRGPLHRTLTEARPGNPFDGIFLISRS